jgi:hypothetical protein
MNSIQELQTLLNSRRKLILVQTYEEQRFIEEAIAVIQSKHYEAVSWSITSGFYDLTEQQPSDKILDPVQCLDKIMTQTKSTCYILKDFHDIWDNKQVKRKLRDLVENKDSIYKPVLRALLSMNDKYPIEGTSKLNNKNETLIYFTDFFNQNYV